MCSSLHNNNAELCTELYDGRAYGQVGRYSDSARKGNRPQGRQGLSLFPPAGFYLGESMEAVTVETGSDRMMEQEEMQDSIAFKREWITRELRAKPDQLLLIYVHGASMVPTLNPGDVILLERQDPAKVCDGIYAIRLGDALLVKRLQFLPGGEILATSDNPAYSPISVKANQPNLAIIGRIVWAGRRF